MYKITYMKKIYTIIIALALTIAVSAENYPYRADYLWVTVPDHADWTYKTGEDAKVEIQLYRYGVPQNVDVAYEVTEDMMKDVLTAGTATLNNGRATISIGTMKEPGFLDCKLTATVDGAKYSHHVKVGFSPEKLTAYTQLPDDFEAFWKANKEEQEAFPLTYTQERAEEYCTDKIDCYLVKITLNRKGQAMYGYLTMPKDAEDGTCPVVLCPPGAGVKTIKEPLRHKYYAENGCVRLEIEIHGLNPTLSADTFSEITKALSNGPNNYLNNGLDNKDNFYMKRVYTGLVRCIDLLTSLPQWDGKNVIVQGGSQGGALAIIAAALDSRVTACVANHPALSDMARYKSGHAGGYPHYFNTPGVGTDEHIRTMAYYDVVNFARFVKATTHLTWGYNDNTCPPTTSYIVYNTLSCPKDALITPINEHWTSDTTERHHLTWILEHLLK